MKAWIVDDPIEASTAAVVFAETRRQMNDTISREAVADAINGIECTRHTTWYEFYQKVMTAVEKLPSAEKTATVSVGKSKGGVTMWYECAACGEPVDQGDTFCSGCGRRLIHE